MTNATAANDPVENDGARIDLGLFAISAVVLALQVLQTRIFSFSLNHLTIYLAIGVCLLGLGASATVLASLPVFARDRARGLAAGFAALGAAAVPLAHAVFARTAESLNETSLLGLITLVILTLPYFSFGMTIALLLVCRSEAIGRAYAANLAGSAAGCLFVFPLLDIFGAESALVAIGVAAVGAALLIEWPRALTSRVGIGAAVVVLVGSQFGSASLFDFPAEARGHYEWILRNGKALAARNPGTHFDMPHLYSKWDRTGRIDVYDFDTDLPSFQPKVGSPIESLLIVQDSSAGSFLLGVGDDLSRASDLFEQTVYGAGYSLGQRDDVLIVGLGGGPDVLSALYHDAKHVVGVEINDAMISSVRDDFGDYQGNPYSRPEVEIHLMDGRTFVESTDQKFDLVQLTSVDTKTVMSTGALALTNNYLYTEESIAAMLRRLRSDGVLAITRFGELHAYRLIVTAASGLAQLGVADPAGHILVIGQESWHTALVKPTPFEPEEVARLHAWVAERSGPVDVVVPALEGINGRFREPMSVIYSPEPRPVAKTPFLKALGTGRLDAFVASVSFDISPSNDDRPYFFFTARIDSLFDEMPPTLRHLFGFALRTTGVAALFILLPLVAMQRRGLRAPGALRALAYFSCLGLGFMLIEIALMNRFVLFLGHQSYAVTIVLFGILVGASLGSATSRFVPITTATPARLILGAIAVGITLYSNALGPIFSTAVDGSFATRVAIALALLVPLGFVLGFPFPIGLRALGEKRVPLIAWAIGINGMASVVGSMMAVPISMIGGLQVVLIAGAGLYALALFAAPIGRPEST